MTHPARAAQTLPLCSLENLSESDFVWIRERRELFFGFAADDSGFARAFADNRLVGRERAIRIEFHSLRAHFVVAIDPELVSRRFVAFILELGSPVFAAMLSEEFLRHGDPRGPDEMK